MIRLVCRCGQRWHDGYKMVTVYKIHTKKKKIMGYRYLVPHEQCLIFMIFWVTKPLKWKVFRDICKYKTRTFSEPVVYYRKPIYFSYQSYLIFFFGYRVNSITVTRRSCKRRKSLVKLRRTKDCMSTNTINGWPNTTSGWLHYHCKVFINYLKTRYWRIKKEVGPEREILFNTCRPSTTIFTTYKTTKPS